MSEKDLTNTLLSMAEGIEPEVPLTADEPLPATDDSITVDDRATVHVSKVSDDDGELDTSDVGGSSSTPSDLLSTTHTLLIESNLGTKESNPIKAANRDVVDPPSHSTTAESKVVSPEEGDHPEVSAIDPTETNTGDSKGETVPMSDDVTDETMNGHKKKNSRHHVSFSDPKIVE